MAGHRLGVLEGGGGHPPERGTRGPERGHGTARGARGREDSHTSQHQHTKTQRHTRDTGRTPRGQWRAQGHQQPTEPRDRTTEISAQTVACALGPLQPAADACSLAAYAQRPNRGSRPDMSLASGTETVSQSQSAPYQRPLSNTRPRTTRTHKFRRPAIKAHLQQASQQHVDVQLDLGRDLLAVGRQAAGDLTRFGRVKERDFLRDASARGRRTCGTDTRSQSQGRTGRRGGTPPPSVQGAQPMLSHCLPDAKCQLQWHL